MDLEGLARLRAYPFAIDVCLVLEERLIGELRGWLAVVPRGSKLRD